MLKKLSEETKKLFGLTSEVKIRELESIQTYQTSEFILRHLKESLSDKGYNFATEQDFTTFVKANVVQHLSMSEPQNLKLCMGDDLIVAFAIQQSINYDSVQMKTSILWQLSKI